MMCCWWLPSCSAIAKSIRCCPVSLHEDCFFEPRIIRFRCRFCRLHKPATGDLQTSYFSCGCLAIYHQCIGVMLMCLWHLKSQKLITRSIPQPSSYVDQMNHLQAKAFDSGTTSFSQVWSLTQLYPNQEHNAGSKSWTWYFTGWRQCTANGWTNTRVRRSNRVHQHVLFWVENKWWVTNLDIDDGIIICILVWMPKRLIFSYRAFLPQHVHGRRTTHLQTQTEALNVLALASAVAVSFQDPRETVSLYKTALCWRRQGREQGQGRKSEKRLKNEEAMLAIWPVKWLMHISGDNLSC